MSRERTIVARVGSVVVLGRFVGVYRATRRSSTDARGEHGFKARGTRED